MPKTNYFLTRCGIRLEYCEHEHLWVDADLNFECDDEGHPIDDNDERLQGIYRTRGAQS